jgi:hypothetical protein
MQRLRPKKEAHAFNYLHNASFPRSPVKKTVLEFKTDLEILCWLKA